MTQRGQWTRSPKNWRRVTARAVGKLRKMKNHKPLICWLVVVFASLWAEEGHAAEPGNSLIIFFVGLIFAPIIQLLVYPILVISDAKPWTIIVVGAISLAWGAFIGVSLVGYLGGTYFCLTLLLFLASYLKKTAKIEKMKAQSNQHQNLSEKEEQA